MQFTLTITMNEKGEVNVTGPIENKILSYGMLECAKQAIANYTASPIVQPSPGEVKRMVN